MTKKQNTKYRGNNPLRKWGVVKMCGSWFHSITRGWVSNFKKKTNTSMWFLGMFFPDGVWRLISSSIYYLPLVCFYIANCSQRSTMMSVDTNDNVGHWSQFRTSGGSQPTRHTVMVKEVDGASVHKSQYWPLSLQITQTWPGMIMILQESLCTHLMLTNLAQHI